MAKERKKAPDDDNGAPSKRDGAVSASESESGSESENDSRRSEGSRDSRRSQSKRKRSRSSSRKSREDDEDSYTSLSESGSESYSDSYSDSESRGSEEYSDSELEERRRRRRKERRKREEKEKEKEKKRRRRKEKEKKRRRKEREEKEDKRRRKNHKEKKKKKKKRDKEKGKKGAVTDSWGKYGIIRETDLWNKRPEFTAWLAEVKQVNLESLPNWEEKQMFKDFMEDHNTATFPSRKYYNLDAYHRRKMEKEMMRGPRKVLETERTIFNDEEQRRLELLRERERQKELEVEALKRSMQGGLAQAMKEQAQLKEEMAYQYKIGNFEAAAAIQRRLDPDIPM